MHPELQEAIDLHHAIVAEAGKALVGYETEKALANIVLLSEIPTTYDKESSASSSRPSATPGSRGCRDAPTCSRPRSWGFR
jgi:hypothetical protein